MPSVHFPQIMKYPIVLAQCFSFFPLCIEYDKLKLWSLVIYSMITFLLFLYEFIAILIQQIVNPNKNIMVMAAVIFHVGSITLFILSFNVSRNWASIVRKWKTVDTAMTKYDVHEDVGTTNIYILSTIMFIAAIEHILVNAYKISYSFKLFSTPCEAFKNYITEAAYSHVFQITSYTAWKGAIFQFLNLQRTFHWNYVDVFLMLMGKALSFRIRQYFIYLQAVVKEKVNGLAEWKTLRLDYVKLVDLCSFYNQQLGYLIMASFSLNIFVILFQIFGTLRPFNNILERIYFFISFGLLLIRVILICIIVGEVNEQWKDIRCVLCNVDSKVFSTEVELLTDLVAKHEITITGNNYFQVTRNLIPAIAGTIVSYELILIEIYKEELLSGYDK